MLSSLVLTRRSLPSCCAAGRPVLNCGTTIQSLCKGTAAGGGIKRLKSVPLLFVQQALFLAAMSRARFLYYPHNRAESEIVLALPSLSLERGDQPTQQFCNLGTVRTRASHRGHNLIFRK